MYSGSRSSAAETISPSTTLKTTPSFASSAASKPANPATLTVSVSVSTTVTLPAGSTALSPYPSRGSPSSAVRMYLPSAAKTIISGCTPVS